jgi:hypothetical protein
VAATTASLRSAFREGNSMTPPASCTSGRLQGAERERERKQSCIITRETCARSAATQNHTLIQSVTNKLTNKESTNERKEGRKNERKEGRKNERKK